MMLENTNNSEALKQELRDTKLRFIFPKGRKGIKQYLLIQSKKGSAEITNHIIFKDVNKAQEYVTVAKGDDPEREFWAVKLDYQA